MQPVLDVIQRIGPSDANVLITGENGTGKGVMARAIHAASAQAAKPLITVNMEAFQKVCSKARCRHVKGAFTDAKNRSCRKV